MADADHLQVLRDGARAWNAWRDSHPEIVPDLADAELSLGQRQFGPSTGGPINLRLANLEGAMLRHATLVGADLENARLQGADLAYARLNGARLTAADLTGAILDQADFREVRLDGAILCGASLAGAGNLTQGQLDSARGDSQTVLPAGLVRPQAWRAALEAEAERPAAEEPAPPQATPDDNPFALLGLTPSAKPDDIRAAYRGLAKLYHPDLNPGDEEAAQRFKRVNEAYRISLAPPAKEMPRPRPPFHRTWTGVAAIFLLAMLGPSAGLYWFMRGSAPSVPAPNRPAAPVVVARPQADELATASTQQERIAPDERAEIPPAPDPDPRPAPVAASAPERVADAPPPDERLAATEPRAEAAPPTEPMPPVSPGTDTAAGEPPPSPPSEQQPPRAEQKIEAAADPEPAAPAPQPQASAPADTGQTDSAAQTAAVAPDTAQTAPVAPDVAQTAAVAPDTTQTAPVAPDAAQTAAIAPDTTQTAAIASDNAQTAPLTPDTYMLELPARRPYALARSQHQIAFANLRRWREKHLWDAARKARGRDGLETYLRSYPAGAYAGQAKQRLAALKADRGGGAEMGAANPTPDAKNKKRPADSRAKADEPGTRIPETPKAETGNLALTEPPNTSPAPSTPAPSLQQSPRVRWPSSDEPFVDRLPGGR